MVGLVRLPRSTVEGIWFPVGDISSLSIHIWSTILANPNLLRSFTWQAASASYAVARKTDSTKRSKPSGRGNLADLLALLLLLLLIPVGVSSNVVYSHHRVIMLENCFMLSIKLK